MEQAVHLSPRVEAELVEYRGLSGWAVAALVLGLLSPTAILTPLLWLVPVIGIVVALVAMRNIKMAQGQKTGWYVALLGMLLSIFFGAAGPARAISRNIWLETRAQRLARVFVDLLRENKPLEAHELTKTGSQRKQPAPNALEVIEKNPDMKREYDRFLKNDLVKALLEQGEKAQIESLSVSFLSSDEGRETMIVHYHITSSDPAQPLSFPGEIVLQRSTEQLTGKEQWRVMPVAPAGED
jgi:hypothetical protein